MQKAENHTDIIDSVKTILSLWNWKDQFTIVVLEHKKELTYIIEI